jgi:PAS domain S-box-containing protein
MQKKREQSVERSPLDIELSESRKFLQTIIDTEPECVKLLNADGGLIMMNRAGLDMIQVDSLDQVKGTLMRSLISPEYRRAFVKLTDDVFQGESGTLTFEMTGVKGRRLWLETHAVPLRNDSDEIIALLGITRDVTERKKSEDALKKERDFIAAVLNTVGAMVLVLDRTGKIIRFNRTCETVCGYSFEEVRDRHVWDFLVPPEEVEGVKKVFSSLTAGMFPNKHENYWIAKDGTRKLISWSNTALLDAGGAIEYVIPTGIDITEHRKAENALKEEKKFSDTIIDSLPGMFYICDQEGRLLRWNNNEKAVTGYSVEELSRMNVLELFREDRALIANILQEVLDKGRASAEARITTKSGSFLPFLLTGFRMTTNEKQYIVGVGIDISERRKLEEQLRQSQKMESIGTLAGGIAHDFNNILTAVIGYGSLLQLKMRRDDPLMHNVGQILASANRAASLTQSLLAYSRKQLLNPRVVDLNAIIRKVEQLLAHLIGEDVEMKTMLAEKQIFVLADPGQIEQVLMNLAANARDAMPDGGKLYIETELTEMDEEGVRTHDVQKPGLYALIAVTDSGMGMDEKTRERIFEPFFTTKEVGKGTGLGLAMVYGIIKQHEGSVHVYSEEGRGTTFKIYLPVVPATTEDACGVELSPIKGGAETLLVAEDDEAVRTLTSSMLEQFGYTVIQAEDGEDAVNKFMANRDKVRLLLLDVIMPKKNGKEVYDKIRIFDPAVKALFLSGYNAEVIHQKGLLDKGLHFILKPVPMNDLLRKVRSILDEPA